jgi:hypothetical protein
MPLLPASGQLSISQINAEFGRGNSLGNYKGVKYYLANNRRGYFPSGSNAYVDISAFYSKRATSPVTPGSWTRSEYGTYSFTVPMFNIMTITVTGAQGGQAGSNGYYFNGDNNGQVSEWGGPAYGGNGSAFGPYVSASGGSGGVTSSAGGQGGATSSLNWNVDSNSSLFNLYNQVISVTVGRGGGGGGGGMNKLWRTDLDPDRYVDWYRSGDGGEGAAGSVTISWT